MPISVNDRVAPNTVTGARGPEQLPTGRIQPDVKDELIQYVNESAPLTVLSDAKDMAGAQETTQYEFTFGEKDIMPLDITIAAAVIPADTSITLNAGHNARVPKTGLYRHPGTGEIVRVSAQPDTATAVITVLRAWGASSGAPAAQNMSAGDRLFFLGTAHGDGASKVRPISAQEVLLRGYTQIQRTSVGVTGRNRNTKTFFGSDWEELKMQAKKEHMRALDLMGFYSVKHSYADTDSGHLVTTSDSLNNRIVSKTATFAEADLNYDLFVDIAKVALKDGKSGYLNAGTRTKYMFAGMAFQARMDKVFNPAVFYEQEDIGIPGVEIRGIKTSAGKIMFVYTPVLDDMQYVSGGKTWYDAFIVDMAHVMIRYHAGRNTKLLLNRQDNSEDSEIAEYFSDKGWQIENEAAHMKVSISN